MDIVKQEQISDQKVFYIFKACIVEEKGKF